MEAIFIYRLKKEEAKIGDQGEFYMSRGSRMAIVLISTFFMLAVNLIDYWTTSIAITTFGIDAEMNKASAFLISNYLYYPFKIIMVMLYLGYMYWAFMLKKGREKKAVISSLIIFVVYMVVLCSNVYQIYYGFMHDFLGLLNQ